MKIYTKSGDQGTTALWGGMRVKKNHPRVAVYGTIDEANSMIGLAVSLLPKTEVLTIQRLTTIQSELFTLGSELATPPGVKTGMEVLEGASITRLEAEIDEMDQQIEPLRNFILPGGAQAAAAINLARAITRRAERECVNFLEQVSETEANAVRPEVIQYLNRLSDYLFVCGRWINHQFKETETKWAPRKK